MRLLLTLLILFSTTFCFAQQVEAEKPSGVEVILKVNPEPRAISHNLVFIVDASSTINRSPNLTKMFNKSWDIIVEMFASDELYFRTYVFHDRKSEKRTVWVDAGGPQGFKKFAQAKKWVLMNTGIRSWGLKAIRTALRDKCPLDKNPSTNRRLTVVLITDGGLTEAAEPDTDDEELCLKSTLKDHIYATAGGYGLINKTIEKEQALRVKRGLEPATILTIGLENKEADAVYGLSVKQRDPDCQAWLKSIGKKYGGGYFLVRIKE